MAGEARDDAELSSCTQARAKPAAAHTRVPAAKRLQGIPTMYIHRWIAIVDVVSNLS